MKAAKELMLGMLAVSAFLWLNLAAGSLLVRCFANP
jgi:hypothetical protein